MHLLNDSQFVSHSFLSNFLTFSVRNDPFFLRPILALEKKTEEGGQLTSDELQLRELVQVQPAHLHCIMSAVEELHNELNANIRNRKAFSHFSLNKVKSMSLDQLSKVNNQEMSPIRRLKLEPMQQYQSQSLRTEPRTHKQQASLAKSNVVMRRSSPVSKLAKQTFQDNPESSPNLFQMIESDKLKGIKEEVFRKVKEELEYETKKSILKSKQFE